MFDYAVVGAGVGGVLSSALLSHMGKQVALFEAQGYLGGCASTFSKGGYSYNTGATTFVGAEPIFKIANALDIDLPIKPIDLSMTIYIGNFKIPRWKDPERSIFEIKRAFGAKRQDAFWQRTLKLSSSLWELVPSALPFHPIMSPIRMFLKSPKKTISSFLCNFISAKSVAKFYLGDISQDFESFLDHHCLITAQGKLSEIPFSVASMGICYPNLQNYRVIGGMSAIMEAFAKKVPHIFRKTLVQSVEPKKEGFLLKTTKGEFFAKRVILNTTVFDAGKLCKELSQYSLKATQQYSNLWGAFVIYMTVENPISLEGHHLILLREPIPNTFSRSLFVSISHPEDPLLSKDSTRSITISTHTILKNWENLSKEEYLEKKQKTTEYCLNLLYEHLPELKTARKLAIFSATPKTFHKYTMRYRGSVGGIPLYKSYFPLNYPGPITPVKGLYIIGDTVFPGQGWPGVATGVINLILNIEGKLPW
ncbi:MAG: NAD(P)/FAD-dependent oxidoreductase [Aquificaceae bacterium]